ncbi:dynein heavy chain family protein, partial [Cardiosporidium cionae]
STLVTSHSTDEVEQWHLNLVKIQDLLEEWQQAQKLWINLDGIFIHSDMARQVPTETKQFQSITIAWKQFMRNMKDTPTALEAATCPDNLNQLKSLTVSMEFIWRSLEHYLKTKRKEFPRFYFLSDAELLEILSNSRDPLSVQIHLRKCFENLLGLTFKQGAKFIEVVGIEGVDGESVQFTKGFKARGPVEKWLPLLEDAMVKTLRECLKACIKLCLKEELDILHMEYPAQVVSCARQIVWCSRVEQTIQDISNGKIKWEHIFEENAKSIEDFVTLVKGKDITLRQRQRVMCLVVEEIQHRDALEEIATKRNIECNSFDWQKQLKYYWKTEENDCVIRQMNAELWYGYEYQTFSSRLVVTPLTERCWLTITGALQLKLGVAAVGPAGTGKTESVKDLAKALGQHCLVFNCSDQIDYKIMEKLFAGVAATGAWTCLDEFNRIDIEVLSVIAQQLQLIHQASVENRKDIIIEGSKLSLKPSCGVFVTMNSGYAGRTELPDNLKIFFRPVAMMFPDFSRIAETMLFAEGFRHSRCLATKFITMINLCKEQLTKHSHYEFGLRTVKATLTLAGILKRLYSSMPEDALVVQAARDWNLPKLSEDEKKIFEEIVSDLFPGKFPPMDNAATKTLETAVQEAMRGNNLQSTETIVCRAIQLHEILKVRTGVIILGPAMSGKSVTHQALSKALCSLSKRDSEVLSFQGVERKILNPKCVSLGELYGQFDEATDEWCDGLLSCTVRNYTKSDSKESKWIILDGPIDALWIESMNTVLDDSQMLCLASGERIKIPMEVKLLFETTDLSAASPATISRCGLIFFGHETVTWKLLVRSWLERKITPTFTAAISEQLWGYFEIYIDPGLKFIMENCKECMELTDNAKLSCLCSLLEGFLLTELSGSSNTLQRSDDEATATLMEGSTPYIRDLAYRLLPSFCSAFVWSLGSALNTSSRLIFSTYCKKVMDAIRWPRGETVFDVMYDPKKGRFFSWEERIPSFEYSPHTPLYKVMVPTKETTKYTFLVETSVTQKHPVLLTGSRGSGKSSLLHAYFASKRETTIPLHPIELHFSASTQSCQTQLFIEALLDRKHKKRLGAPEYKKLILYIEDVNLPQGVYDRKKFFWKDIDDLLVLLSCNLPGGAQNVLSSRFLRHFYVLAMADTPLKSLHYIYSSLMDNYFSHQSVSTSILAFSKTIVDKTLDLYSRFCEYFIPTAKMPQYSFSLRQLSHVFQGIQMAHPSAFEEEASFVRLWKHELHRIFGDRISDITHKIWFEEQVKEISFKYLSTEETISTKESSLWSTFLKNDDGERIYQEIPESFNSGEFPKHFEKKNAKEVL